MGSVIHDDNLHNRVPQMGSSVNSKTYKTSAIIKVRAARCSLMRPFEGEITSSTWTDKIIHGRWGEMPYLFLWEDQGSKAWLFWKGGIQIV